MAKDPKITVCITAQRFDIFFKRAVDSVLSQTVKPYEVLLIIDGRSDRLLEQKVFRDIPLDWLIYWTELEDSGPAVSKNIGLYYATGDWILMLDGDDFLIPSCLEVYTKMIPTLKSDVIAEFLSPSLVHNNMQVTRNIPPDRTAWDDFYKFSIRTLFSGSWKRGEMPIRPLLIRLEGKKYYPQDYSYLEDKMLCFYYMLEERRIYLSDFCSYIVNNHPGTISAAATKWGQTTHPDIVRFKRVAANINITGWIVREKIFEQTRTSAFFTSNDSEYIDKSVRYFSFL